MTFVMVSLMILLYGLNDTPPIASKVPALLPFARRLKALLGIEKVCLNPQKVIYESETYRLLVSCLVHLNEVHLLHNMMSFLHKGAALESRMSTSSFAFLVLFLCITSHGLYVVFAFAMLQTGLSSKWMRSCVVGFSSILFGLTIVLSAGRNRRGTFGAALGLRLPLKAAAFELVIAQVLVPNASFLSHFCGVVAGFIFVGLRVVLTRFSITTITRLCRV